MHHFSESFQEKSHQDEGVNQENERHEIYKIEFQKTRKAIIERCSLTAMHETRKAASQPWGGRNVPNCRTRISYDMSGKIVRELGKNYSQIQKINKNYINKAIINSRKKQKFYKKRNVNIGLCGSAVTIFIESELYKHNNIND